jgi:hypothetical protein
MLQVSTLTIGLTLIVEPQPHLLRSIEDLEVLMFIDAILADLVKLSTLLPVSM